MYTTVLMLSPRDAADGSRILSAIAREKGLAESEISGYIITKRSIDARQRNIKVRLEAEVYTGETPRPLYEKRIFRWVDGRPQAVVVGSGPAGLFAALRLIELGIRPVVLERGRDVHSRKKDIAAIRATQSVDPESNYSFGEGGAGTYSDGKLYTRSKKRGPVDRILATFCQAGADPAILSSAHPHIGTDRLPRIIENIRNIILTSGGEVHFQTRAEALLTDSHGRVCGVCDALGNEYSGPVILATGHSARDVYRSLRASDFALECKGLAAGVRLEHPSFVIDCLQYHTSYGRGKWLPAAEYSMTAQVEGRGVYSFCMCPGGFVVPAATGAEQIVVNGMSPASRGSKWSNSGMVVEIRPEDLAEESLSAVMSTAMGDEGFAVAHPGIGDSSDPLRMMYFQEALERECWLQGNRRQTAPAQRMGDFVNRRLSSDLPASSYAPGLIASPLHFWLPQFIYTRLSEGFRIFGARHRGFLSSEATVIAVETRTSSPVRVMRDAASLQSLSHEGLFPAGEGAGYSGGIVSSAIDGERAAEALSAYLEARGEA